MLLLILQDRVIDGGTFCAVRFILRQKHKNNINLLVKNADIFIGRVLSKRIILKIRLILDKILKNRMNFSKIGRYLLIPFAVFVSFIPIFDPLNVFSSLRNTAFDLFQNISPRESMSSDTVIVLDIDEKSLSEIGQWPWPRSVLADLVNKTYLSASLGFDIVFAEFDRTGSNELKKQYKR